MQTKATFIVISANYHHNDYEMTWNGYFSKDQVLELINETLPNINGILTLKIEHKVI